MHIETIEKLLLRLPALIEQQERRSPDFASNAAAWLRELELAFESSRLYQTANLAALRSGLVAAAQGQVPAGLEFRGRATRGRVLAAASAQVMQRASDIATAVMAEHRARIAEAERVAQQIIAVANARRLVAARLNEVDNTKYLQILRRTLATENDLAAALAHLEGFVGPHDALILLDRALTPYGENASKDFGYLRDSDLQSGDGKLTGGDD